MKKYVLMSIKPEYAKKIKNGEKTIELRRTLPKISPNDILVVYETSPVQAITSYCQIHKLISADPNSFWNMYSESLGISKKDYDTYFAGKSLSCGIVLDKIVVLDRMRAISEVMEKPYVPQSFCYLTEKEFSKLQS